MFKTFVEVTVSSGRRSIDVEEIMYFDETTNGCHIYLKNQKTIQCDDSYGQLKQAIGTAQYNDMNRAVNLLRLLK